MQVVIAPDTRLRIQTRRVKKISPALIQTLKEMVKLTKTFKDPEGVGLASTQVGLDEAFFVAKNEQSSSLSEEQFESFINPQILSTGKRTKKYFEGCLSIPDIWGQINRYTNIKVSYQDETGKTIIRSLKGVLAWIFQHEVDHLNGKLFPERVLEQKGRFFKYTGKDKTGTDMFDEITI